MLLNEKAKKLLNKYGHNYTDAEIKIIREFVSILIDIDFKLFERKMEEELSKKDEAKIINLNTDTNEKSNSLHPGEYRRAS